MNLLTRKSLKNYSFRAGGWSTLDPKAGRKRESGRSNATVKRMCVSCDAFHKDVPPDQTYTVCKILRLIYHVVAEN